MENADPINIYDDRTKMVKYQQECRARMGFSAITSLRKTLNDVQFKESDSVAQRLLSLRRGMGLCAKLAR